MTVSETYGQSYKCGNEYGEAGRMKPFDRYHNFIIFVLAPSIRESTFNYNLNNYGFLTKSRK